MSDHSRNRPCPKCGRLMVPGGDLRPSKDHILPRVRRGQDFIHGDVRNTIVVCQDCNGFRAACHHCWAFVACVDAVAIVTGRDRWCLLARWASASSGGRRSVVSLRVPTQVEKRAAVILSAARKYAMFNAPAPREDYIFPADTAAKQVWNLAVLAKGGEWS